MYLYTTPCENADKIKAATPNSGTQIHKGSRFQKAAIQVTINESTRTLAGSSIETSIFGTISLSFETHPIERSARRLVGYTASPPNRALVSMRTASSFFQLLRKSD